MAPPIRRESLENQDLLIEQAMEKKALEGVTVAKIGTKMVRAID